MLLLKKSRIILSILILFITLVPVSSTYAAFETIKVSYAPMHFVYDGKEYAPPENQRAFLYNDSTFIPIRFMTNMFRKEVTWDGDTYTVGVREPNKEELIIIDEYNLNTLVRDSDIQEIDTSLIEHISVDVSFTKVTYIFDDDMKEPPAELPGMILNDRIYVPMRFFSESLALEIEWDPTTYTVAAQSDEYTAVLEALNPNEGIVPDGEVPGGVPSSGDPTYDSIINATEIQISELEDEAKTYFLSLYARYGAAEEAEQPEIITTGQNKLTEFDNRFAAIMSDLRTELTDHNYSTAQADEYEVQYENLKELAKSFIGL